MSTDSTNTPGAMSRRGFLVLAGSAAGLLATARPAGALVHPARTTTARVSTPTSSIDLQAARTTVDLGGRTVNTWAYNGSVPGPLLRVRAGETVRARVANQLDAPTTVHWHGIALANAMDGIPGITQKPIGRDAVFDYDFTAPDPGTYFFHPHVGVQLDHGLYAPLIVDDPADPGSYDAEWIVMLDDWTDGVGRSPEKILAGLRKGMGKGMDMGSHESSAMGSMSGMRSRALGGMAGDVAYPLYLINGRGPSAPETFTAKAGQRVRIRLINAGSDTAFRFAIGGHRLTVTHADGFPVVPIETDAVLLGMGERIDLLVTCKGDANPVVARAEGKGKAARAVLRAGTGSIRSWDIPELGRQLLTVAELSPAESVVLPPRAPDRTHKLVLGGNDMRYRWTLNGKTYDPAERYPVSAGERVRLEFRNTSTMWHPMHLHGHTFAVLRNGTPGVRKDTVVVKPGDTVKVDFDAGNPGAWMVHCHNTYHQESGMMTTLEYT
jgi:FtsP/CotA-like multicopper oxidase with cupredoxin domain